MIASHAGTYIYHTHWHDAAQLTGGVHGTMIVLNPDGSRSWLYQTGFECSCPETSPVIGRDGTIYFINGNDTVLST